MQTVRHARLAALALGACLAIACGGDRAGDDSTITDSAGGSVASAAVTSGAGTGSMEAEPRNDTEIMTLVAEANDAEVSSSQLALENAGSAQVKQFAQQMIADHAAMQMQGAQVAKALGADATGSDSTQARHDMMNEQLGDLQDRKGADFDSAYVELQVQAHQKTIDDLHVFQAKAQNADLKAMITNAIPKVEAHLQNAQQLQQVVQGRRS